MLKLLYNTVTHKMINPRVVHSIPGRLRLHIPALQRLPEGWRMEESFIEEMVGTVEHVKNVSVSYVTGNALIVYDHQVLTEQDIINHLKRMAKFLVDRAVYILDTPVQKIPMLLKSLGKRYIEENDVEVSPLP